MSNLQAPSADDEQLPEKVKIVAIGDEQIGKSCLLMAFRPDNTSLVPSIFNPIDVRRSINLNGSPHTMNISLCDTGSSLEYQALRAKCYKNADVVLVCFDIGNIQTLHSISNGWLPELEQLAPHDPILILCALKSDLRLREQHADTLISTQQISEFRQQYADTFSEYVEVSAVKKQNVDTPFELGIDEFYRTGHQHRKSTAPLHDDVDYEADPTDVVGTHTKQWQSHLKEMSSHNIFAQYNSANTSEQINSQYSMGAMSYQSTNSFYNMPTVPHQMSMGGMSNMSGMHPLSYHSTGTYFGGGQTQTYVPPSEQGTMLGDLDEDQEIQPVDVPPPPPQPQTDGMKGDLDDLHEQTMALTNSPKGKKLSVSAKRSESIDYELEKRTSNDSGTPKKGACCVVL